MNNSLYIVSTPIGNLNDITQRAIDTLSSVDLIAAEDTRHSRKLLDFFNISTPIVSYHNFSGDGHTHKLIDRLISGKSVALISDAGTPLVSDPGYLLVKEAHKNGINVVPIPGACALVAALSASGLPTDHFSFQGFLPAKKGARLSSLKKLRKNENTLIFYEAPHRVLESLGVMQAVFGDLREAVLAREITKNFETIKKLPLSDLYQFVASDTNQQRGEIVILVEGYREEVKHVLPEDCISMIGLLVEDMTPKKISKILSQHYNVPNKAIYDYIVYLKKNE